MSSCEMLLPAADRTLCRMHEVLYIASTMQLPSVTYSEARTDELVRSLNLRTFNDWSDPTALGQKLHLICHLIYNLDIVPST